ncbi:DUF732 domain-containing protein [Mycobacterium kansasii]|uniref:DUF732 domain-containing protein n=1 Tax=Mycobacterium kansasii TaxID=1768 RepID=UPI0009EF7513|nr:hypothetical protein B1T43_06500 [Mycobacterium kansasii]
MAVVACKWAADPAHEKWSRRESTASLIPWTPAKPTASFTYPTGHAEHLQPPRPTSGPSADALYLDALRRSGLTITDVSAVIDGGHAICDYLRQGHSGAEAANIAMSNNSTLRPVDALGSGGP